MSFLTMETVSYTHLGMTKKIFHSILLVAGTVLLASLLVIMGLSLIHI